MKKVVTAIGITLLLSFNFLGVECLLYILKVKGNILFYPAFVVLLLTVLLVSTGIKKLGLFRRNISDCIVLIAVFISLGALKFIV